MPVPVRFVVGALLGVLLLLPGLTDETPGIRALLLLLGALAFGTFSVRRLARFWDALGERLARR